MTRTDSANRHAQIYPWRDFDFSRIASGALYYYVGAGLSMSAGLVSWHEMVCQMWRYRKCYEKEENLGPCPDDSEESNEKRLEEFVQAETTLKDNKLVRILSRDSANDANEEKALGRTALLNMLLRYRGPVVQLMPQANDAVPNEDEDLRQRAGQEPSQEDLAVQSLIWRSRCHGVLTTNYDLLLEHAYSASGFGASLRSYRYTADFLRFILSNPQFVLKMHGDINDLRTIEFRPKSAWEGGALSEDKGSRGEDLKRVYGAALNRGHMIYLGCGFRDETIQRLHRSWQPIPQAGLLSRLAIVPRNEITDGRIVPSDYRDIEFLTWHGDGATEVRLFLERIVSERSALGRPAPACPEASDIHEQVFMSREVAELRRRMATEHWTCKGRVPS